MGFGRRREHYQALGLSPQQKLEAVRLRDPIAPLWPDVSLQ
jgi:hypothetical protein